MFDLQPSRTALVDGRVVRDQRVLLAAALILPTLFPPRTIVNAFLPDRSERAHRLAEPSPGQAAAAAAAATR